MFAQLDVYRRQKPLMRNDPEKTTRSGVEVDTLVSLLSSVVDSSEDAIVSKTLDGIITSWNRAAEKIFGYTAEEAIGRSIRLIIPPERQQEEDYVLGQLRRGEKVDHFETERLTKDGRRLDISLTVSPVRDATGKVVGASKIARDITEKKQLERERELAQ
jgi:PAS domain S-box-containing protein